MESLEANNREVGQQRLFIAHIKHLFNFFDVATVRSSDRDGRSYSAYSRIYTKDDTDSPIFSELGVDEVSIDYWKEGSIPISKEIGGRAVTKNIYRPQIKLSMTKSLTKLEEGKETVTDVRRDSFLIVEGEHLLDEGVLVNSKEEEQEHISDYVIIPRRTELTAQGYSDQVLKENILDLSLLEKFESLLGIKQSE